MSDLQIRLFGDVTVLHPSDPTPLKLSRSTQAFLAYLLMQKHLVPRDLLMDLFWVDYRPDRARSSLTTAIWRLRQLLEPDGVQPGTYLVTKNTGEVGFNWESSHWLDTESFEQDISPLLHKPLLALCDDDMKRLNGSLTLYRGELLEGIYEDWALRERERFRSLYLNCLTRLMEFHASRHDLDQSIAYGHEILRQDPLREEIHRDLMRMYLDSGQRRLAIRQYTQCRDLLMQELGIPPLEETQALYQQIFALSPSDTQAKGQLINQEIGQLAHELQLVKRHLDETTLAFERLAQSIGRLIKNGENSPLTPISSKR